MACFVPFNSRNLDISLMILRPTVVLVDELVEALRRFSSCTETLGCVHSAIFTSIHGNMIILYGAWMKRTNENKELVNQAILSMLANISTMAVLIDHTFYESYAGESKDGTPAARFSRGDTISINSASLSTTPHGSKAEDNNSNLSYACLALFKSHFLKMEGATAGVCLKCRSRPQVVSVCVWKSLRSCYSWILLKADFRTTLLHYLDDGVSIDMKYDIFRVVSVSTDNKNDLFGFEFSIPSTPRMLGNEAVENQGNQVVQGNIKAKFLNGFD